MLYRLDIRQRLTEFLEQNPDCDLLIPAIPGIYPLSPLTEPLAHSTPPSCSPISRSSSKPSTPADALTTRDLSGSRLSSTPQTSPFAESNSSPIVPILKPTAPEFKPTLLRPSDPISPSVSSIWGPPLPVSHPPPALSLFPRSSPLSPHRMTLSPSLNAVGEEDEEGIVTDSDADVQEDLAKDVTADWALRKNAPTVDVERIHTRGEEDDIPLSRLQHNLQQHNQTTLRSPMFSSFLSLDDSRPVASRPRDELDGQSDCTNPSDEADRDDTYEEEEDARSSIRALPNDSIVDQSVGLIPPSKRTRRSHTFGMDRLNAKQISMSAGNGRPHNWINGIEDEEEDILSNSSDDEEAELHQLKRTIIRSSFSEATSSPSHQSNPTSSFKTSTPTSRLLLATTDSPQQATNLAITVGRATGNIMSPSLIDGSSSESPIPKLDSLSSLNAFAPEFKPSFTFSTPSIQTSSPPLETFSKSKSSSTSSMIPSISQPDLKSHGVCSIGRGVKRQKTTPKTINWDDPKDNVPDSEADQHHAAPDKTEAIILFENPVSSAPFQVSNSLPALSTLSTADPPLSPARKLDQVSEQPGKDNMRTFKFPVTSSSSSSRMVLYQAQAPRSNPFPPSVVLPVSDSAPISKLPSFPHPLQLASQLGSVLNPSLPTISQPTYLSSAFDKSASPILDQIDSDVSISLRQRSSFEDDSGSELSPTASRTLMVDQTDSVSFYELIPTQPRSTCSFTGEEPEDEEDHRSPDSLLSLSQLQEQKRQWGQFSCVEPSIKNGSHSGFGNRERSESDHRALPTESIRVLLEVDPGRRRESGPPRVMVPPGSPFSPFEGMMDSSLGSLAEEPPTLILPGPSPYRSQSQALSPRIGSDLSRNVRGFGNVERSTRSLTDPQCSKATRLHSRPSPSSPHEEELDGIPNISIRNRNLTPSALSPVGARWPARSDPHTRKPPQSQRRLSKSEDDEAAFDSRDTVEDEESSSRNSSSDSSPVSVKISPGRYRNRATCDTRFSSNDNRQHQLLLMDLERLLTRKLKGLRKDLGSLHSLKVDWDSLKRDAILDEINVRMDNVLHSWIGSGKEQIEALISGHNSDPMLEAIDRWGKKTETSLIRAIEDLPSLISKSNFPAAGQPEFEVICRIKSELEVLNSRLQSSSLELDLDRLTKKLSEAVKPQIGQLIDLASDKSETADLILKELRPRFTELATEFENSMKALSAEIAQRIVGKTTDSDQEGITEVLRRLEDRLLAAPGMDLLSNLLPRLEQQPTQEGFDQLKAKMVETIESLGQMNTKTSDAYQDLSLQIDRVGQDFIGRLKVSINEGMLQKKQTDEIIERLKAKNSELEASVNKARFEYGKIRSERAVEREKLEDERSELVKERDRWKHLADQLQVQLDREILAKGQIETERNQFEGQANQSSLKVEETRLLMEELKVQLDSHKTQEVQWQHLRAEQDETILKLRTEKRMDESAVLTIKKELEFKERIHDTRVREKDEEIKLLKRIQMDQSDQIKKLIQDQIPLIKSFDHEVRELVIAKADSDGEIRTLRKRVTDQDEQIGNLHQSSASKQQALAMANQRLSELERRGKQECEGYKTEIESLKAELNRMMEQSDARIKLDYQEKAGLEGEIDRLRTEAGIVKEEVESVYQKISIELKESNERQIDLENEVTSLKDVNQLLKNQLEDLRAHHQKQDQLLIRDQTDRHSHHHHGLMVSSTATPPEYPQPNLGWKSIDRLNSTSPRPPSLSIQASDGDHHDPMPDFIHSTITLSQSIHAPTSHQNHGPLERRLTTGFEGNGRPSYASSSYFPSSEQSHHHPGPEPIKRADSRTSSIGTVRSYRQPSCVAHDDRSDHHHRFVPAPNFSPTPSHHSSSVLSRLTLDNDGWWSSTD